MARMALIKMLISIMVVLVCANHPTQDQTDLLDHVQQERHWQGLAFHSSWILVSRLSEVNPSYGTADRLQMLSPIMGCAYGVKLNWALSLTVQAAEECKELQRDEDDRADDCMASLGGTVQDGKRVLLKLMRTLELVDSIIGGNSVDHNRFYQTLKPLREYLTGQTAIELEDAAFNRLLEGVAGSLAAFLHTTCQPSYRLFDIDTTRDEYDSETFTNGVYDFYTHLVNYYLDWIQDHLIQLGFHYDESTDHITFDPSQSG